MSDQSLLVCQREIRRLRVLVGHYGRFYDEVKKAYDNPKTDIKEFKEEIRKLLAEYDN